MVTEFLSMPWELRDACIRSLHGMCSVPVCVCVVAFPLCNMQACAVEYFTGLDGVITQTWA